MSSFSGRPWKIDPHKHLAPNFSHLLDSWWKEMATHSSVLAWRIPWTEEPGGLLSIGSHRVRHDWSDLACMHALEKEMAAHSSVLSWRIPGTREPGGLQSVWSHRAGHDWGNLAAAVAADSWYLFSCYLHCIGGVRLQCTSTYLTPGILWRGADQDS